MFAENLRTRNLMVLNKKTLEGFWNKLLWDEAKYESKCIIDKKK